MSTYYLATTGVDSGTGTSRFAPWRHWSFAVPQLVAGDTLVALTGTYAEPMPQTVIQGQSWVNPITMIADSGAMVTLQPPSGSCNWVIDWFSGQQYVVIDGINLDSSLAQVGHDMGGISIDYSPNVLFQADGAHHIRFKNADTIGNRLAGDVSTSRVGIDCRGSGLSQGCEFITVNVHGSAGNNSYYGGYIHSNDNLFDGLNVYDIGWIGLQIFDLASTPSGNIVRNSLFHDIIRAYVGSRVGVLDAGDNTLVYNNIFYNINSDQTATDPCAALVAYSGTGKKYLNNTITSNHGNAINVNPGTTGTIIDNNVAYGNDFDGVSDLGSGTDVRSANLFGTDPLFKNAGAHDYEITTSSAARDTGTSYSTIFGTDIVGVARPQGAGWDKGAYELQSLSQNISLPTGSGSYTETGTAVTFRIASPIVLGVLSGTYTETGSDVTLVPPAITLAVSATSYAMTGSAVTLGNLRIVPDSGSYALTGTDVTLIADTSQTMTADAGSYTLTGMGALLTSVNYTMAAGNIAYAETGSATSGALSALDATSSTAYAMTGTAATLTSSVGYFISTASGTYTMTGTDVTLTAATSQTATVSGGSYAMSGTDVTLTIAPLPITPSARTGHGRRMAVPVERRQGPHSIKVPVDVEGAVNRVIGVYDGEGYTHR